jgi:hypothetical protein
MVVVNCRAPKKNEVSWPADDSEKLKLLDSLPPLNKLKNKAVPKSEIN